MRRWQSDRLLPFHRFIPIHIKTTQQPSSSCAVRKEGETQGGMGWVLDRRWSGGVVVGVVGIARFLSDHLHSSPPFPHTLHTHSSRPAAVVAATPFGARAFSTTRSTAFKVAVIGAGGGIGQPLSLLLKQHNLITNLSLYDISPVIHGVTADLSHCDSPAKVEGHQVRTHNRHGRRRGCG